MEEGDVGGEDEGTEGAGEEVGEDEDESHGMMGLVDGVYWSAVGAEMMRRTSAAA